MKNILVTGAYGGMGRANVQKLKAQGFHVFALDKHVGEAEENVVPIAADVTDEESVRRAAETVQAQAGNCLPLFILRAYICLIRSSRSRPRSLKKSLK